jgi:hypothetical protein
MKVHMFFNHTFQYFSYIVMACFIDKGNQRKLLTNFYHIMLHRVRLAMSGIQTQSFSDD